MAMINVLEFSDMNLHITPFHHVALIWSLKSKDVAVECLPQLVYNRHESHDLTIHYFFPFIFLSPILMMKEINQFRNTIEIILFDYSPLVYLSLNACTSFGCFITCFHSSKIEASWTHILLIILLYETYV